MNRRRSKVRSTAAAASLLTAAVASGLVAPASAAADDQSVDVQLAYTCQFPSAQHQVDVRVTGMFPAITEVGAPIQPEQVMLEISIPELGAAELAALGAATVGGTAEMKIDVRQGEGTTSTAWTDLPIPEVSIPDTERLTIVASGPVPPVTVNEPGDVSFTAGALTLALSPHQTNGSPTEPQAVQVTCGLTPDQKANLAVVPTSGTDDSTTPSTPYTGGTGDRDTDGGIEPGSPANESNTEMAPRLLGVEDVPPECLLPSAANPLCSNVVGFSNVQKLGGAVRLGVPEPGLLLVDPSTSVGPCDEPTGVDPEGDSYRCTFAIRITARATLDLPAAESTLLTFGFMPVQAKVKLTLTEPVQVDSVQESRFYPPGHEPTQRMFPLVVTAESPVSMRLYDVTVNGVPLDVGPNCQTAEPLDLVLHGHSAQPIPEDPDEYSVPKGGVLTGMVTIPAFSGCGVAEDLDPLLTGSISGPGNFVKMTQGQPCFVATGDFCPPEIPEPLR